MVSWYFSWGVYLSITAFCFILLAVSFALEFKRITVGELLIVFIVSLTPLLREILILCVIYELLDSRTYILEQVCWSSKKKGQDNT